MKHSHQFNIPGHIRYLLVALKEAFWVALGVTAVTLMLTTLFG